ncbi:metal-dependent peptidase [Perkinsela sp. CCAP 1560/4]|nr:metal-dependent peptidase [Perkinsela sp. CCAP 1560/4]|eukprot:KNH08385.1 metal-dependent peptidase [Perkinsela sp. CCAP 1560/4]
MQGIQRSQVLSKKSHEDQLKYCLLLEAGEILRNITNAPKSKVSELASALPAKYKEMFLKQENQIKDDLCAGIDALPREQMEAALIKCNTDTICAVIGSGISNKKARTFSFLSREFLHFYCVLLDVVESSAKPITSKETMVCMLTAFFYSKLSKKYIAKKIPETVAKVEKVDKPKEEKSESVKRPRSSDSSKNNSKSITPSSREKTPATSSNIKDSSLFKQKPQNGTPPVVEIPAPSPQNEQFTPSPVQQVSAPASRNDLLVKYAQYFEEALAFSPVLPLDSVVKLVGERTGVAPEISDLEHVAKTLHDMMQIVYAGDQQMMYLV